MVCKISQIRRLDCNGFFGSRRQNLGHPFSKSKNHFPVFSKTYTLNTLLFRGHEDSVNEIAWMSRTHSLCTASSDKSISIWDSRNGRRQATFYGHQNSCNHCCLDSKGYLLASCDADGIAKIWDLRKLKEIYNLQVSSPKPINQCCFDKTDEVLNPIYPIYQFRMEFRCFWQWEKMDFCILSMYKQER